MKNKKTIKMEWYNEINDLNDIAHNYFGEDKLLVVPEEEEDLILLTNECIQELKYDWDNIEDLLFNNSRCNLGLNGSKVKLPKGIKDLYEVDENGNFTGKYDWDYIINFIGSIINEHELNILKMWDSEYVDEISEILFEMPGYVSYILTNIDRPRTLSEIIYINNDDASEIDFPMQLRNNSSAMLNLIDEIDNYEGIECFWDLLSTDLKNDKKFLEKLFEKNGVKINSSILTKINLDLYENDDDFKNKMLKIDCCSLFAELWDKTKDSWDLVMSEVDDKEFFRSCDELSYEYYEDDSEFQRKLYDEIDRRITRSVKNGKQIEYHLNGKSTDKIPLNYLMAMLINRDRKNLGIDVQSCISDVNGERLKLHQEVAVYNSEIEDKKDGVVVMYGTDKQGRQNILYYYPDCRMKDVIRQQRILNSKGDVVSMKRISAFKDGRIEDIDEAFFNYVYNEKGQKNYSLSEDGIIGTLYNEYDENGNIYKTTEIPSITEHDCEIIAMMKRAVGRTVGNTCEVEKEMGNLVKNEIELEGEEQGDN